MKPSVFPPPSCIAAATSAGLALAVALLPAFSSALLANTTPSNNPHLESASPPALAPGSPAATVTIEVRPDQCLVDAKVAEYDAAQNLRQTIETVFGDRCYSDHFTLLDPSTGPSEAADHERPDAATAMPFPLQRLEPVLQEAAASPRPLWIQWFADQQRFVLGGESIGNVTRTAIELRLRMALSPSGLDASSMPECFHLDNEIAVVEPRREDEGTVALAKVIERNFSGADLPRLGKIQLPPIYFNRTSGRIDPQEMPKLVDAVDQLSTIRSLDQCPALTITGYVLPRGNLQAERAASKRRATAVRNQLVRLGIPKDRLTIEVMNDVGTGLSWRSGRVEMRISALDEEAEDIAEPLVSQSEPTAREPAMQ